MSSYPNICSICLDDISLTGDEVTILECNHPFHTRCISQLRSNKCPSCRKRFTNISPKLLSPIFQRENADIRTENLNFVLNTPVNDIFLLQQHPPPHNLFRRPFAEPPLPSDIIALVMRSLPPSVSPLIFTLLNTPFQGITLNSILEDYIVRHT